ncbi:MAG: coproporphyrinogen III oxidase, partial [Candidatus Poribacteria bacterium]|nr:coproporphyrinogen III oxidase [Candidatus Poribacteria bacterium]
MDENLEVTKPEPATTRNEARETEVGSVFVSNYPPYSFWSEENLPTVENVLKTPPNIDTDLGLYLHIPF